MPRNVRTGRGARRGRGPAETASGLAKLDPFLVLGAVRAAPAVRPARAAVAAARGRIGELDIGAQAIAAQLSAPMARRFLADELVPVLVDSGDPAVERAITGWRGDAQRITPTTIRAHVPRSRLRELAGMAAVNYVEAGVQLKLHCDLAHRSARLVIDGARTVPQTGAGVLIGVVDSGIDVDHPSFQNNGRSRIVDYLDQETGRRFTAAEIDAGTAREAPDVVGHGTHVAGIAAGNGAGSPQRRLQGVAPDADLAIVRSTLNSVDIPSAVRHVFDIAAQRNQPCVVNLSLGGHVGGHDGSTVVERTIDQLSGSGRMVVVSAGNEGDDPIHAGTVLARGGATRWVADFALESRMFQLDAGPQEFGVLGLQVWHQREDAIDIAVRGPNGQRFAPPPDGRQEFDFGLFFVDCGHQRSPYSGDDVTTFFIVTDPAQEWRRGWSVIAEEVPERGGVQVGAVHAWIRDAAEGHFTSGATRSHLIGMPGTAFSALTVASYATRNGWRSRDPNRPTVELDAINLEDISYFSSIGPTRDGDNKPEVAAPGQWVLAPLSGAAPEEEIPLVLRADGIEYAALQGTSMAAPYVTGALALLLEKDPTLDWSEAKRRLIKSTRRDGLTRVCWNPRWGYGRLDVERLLTIEPTPALVA